MGPAKRMLSGPSLEASAHRLTARTKLSSIMCAFPSAASGPMEADIRRHREVYARSVSTAGPRD